MHQDYLKKKDEFILFFKIVLVQNSWRGKELNQFCPIKISDDLCLFFDINPSSVALNVQELRLGTKKPQICFCIEIQIGFLAELSFFLFFNELGK